jgi:beta-lactamase class A
MRPRVLAIVVCLVLAAGCARLPRFVGSPSQEAAAPAPVRMPDAGASNLAAPKDGRAAANSAAETTASRGVVGAGENTDVTADARGPSGPATHVTDLSGIPHAADTAPRPVSGAADSSDRASAAATESTQAAAEAANAPNLIELLDGIVPTDGANYGVVVEDLVSGNRVAVNDSQVFPSASLYKLGVAWLALRDADAGSLDLDAPLEIVDDDTVEPEPYGGFGAGDVPSVREALEVMIEVSSNAAAHAFLRILGRDALNQELDRIGLQQMRVPPDSDAVTSAADTSKLLRLIATSNELSAASRELLLGFMANIAPPDPLRDVLPDSVAIMDKTGNLDDSSNVAALLESPRGTVICVVVDSGVGPGSARAIIGQVGQAAYQALLQ